MIYPSQTWEKWQPMRDRCWKFNQESATQVCLEMNFDFLPGEVEDNFTLMENALLNATAIAFGISRRDVDAGCENGVIEWRSEEPGLFQARCAGYEVTLPIRDRKWDESYRDWKKKITDMANHFKANKES